MKTKHVIEDLIELTRMAGGPVADPIMFEARLPQSLPEAQAYVTVACAIIQFLTSGPNQDAVLRAIVEQANGITTTIPDAPPDDGQFPER
ncbi:hypothetical protein ABLI39_03930 [Pseudarthrobacter sp. B907]|uniref:hypothetical protein n=1 Tax=Pseudarthrobacter sp. B907 TaxID=3158261 RepID=UPI0032DAD777